MTRLFNDPAAFADELREGFIDANGDLVRGVTGGVVRSTVSRPGSSAVVIGGGSGHYPAFAGLVGPGLASGAAMGNLFASPSAHQVESVGRAADHGGGVLLTCGNYAGDVLNFTAAAEAMRADGIDVRTLWVTDDISSAPASERSKRRGIAGGLVVYKVAGALAEEGAALADVVAAASHANDRTRTLGVAFSGCTFPGASEPLFTVPEGRMAVGMGIHGEPGISETDVPTADGLARMLVEALLGELPDDVPEARGQRALVILNGLGTVKYEEMFVVYRSVARLLAEAGVEVAFSEVGEFCTSFDMAGLSLTITWLDEGLERLWAAPAVTPSFRTGSLEVEPLSDEELAQADEAATAIPPASAESRDAAATVLASLRAAKDVIDANADELGRMDAVAGDGDHGIGMQRGVHAAVDAAEDAVARGAGAGTTLGMAADAWSDRAGGTSGVLWGLLLRTLAQTVGDEERPDTTTVVSGVAAAEQRLRETGGASVGDKTMVDAIVPFAGVLDQRQGDGLAVAWAAAADAATEAAAATADLVPHLGRSRAHGEKSLGTADPGAHSFALIVTAVAAVLEEGN
ncbi:dihydroxyacetone kinase family protein [Pseudolysinimonas kribbensis]|uniref:Erythrulose kinase n=1 Tax=Pseudolysinimonas kribbensis TaxID=433641 RepID=A0ABQ6K1K2_9MICO|nr:dihydroxyacetone kinase family protein [Pseudolysinimonas kribbensis]GMA94483.1 erythrulose kinase [Pseudolysinimonas kribbensis]